MHWLFIEHVQIWIGIGIGGFIGFSYASLIKIAIFSDCEYLKGKADALALDVEFWKKQATGKERAKLAIIPVATTPFPGVSGSVDAFPQANPPAIVHTQTAVGQLAGGRRGLSTAFKSNVP